MRVEVEDSLDVGMDQTLPLEGKGRYTKETQMEEKAKEGLGSA